MKKGTGGKGSIVEFGSAITALYSKAARWRGTFSVRSRASGLAHLASIYSRNTLTSLTKLIPSHVSYTTYELKVNDIPFNGNERGLRTPVEATTHNLVGGLAGSHLDKIVSGRL